MINELDPSLELLIQRDDIPNGTSLGNNLNDTRELTKILLQNDYPSKIFNRLTNSMEDSAKQTMYDKDRNKKYNLKTRTELRKMLGDVKQRYANYNDTIDYKERERIKQSGEIQGTLGNGPLNNTPSQRAHAAVFNPMSISSIMNEKSEESKK